jgi:hypothetical protein
MTSTTINVTNATFTGTITYDENTPVPPDPTPPPSTEGRIENFNASSGARFQVDGKEVANANAGKAWSLVKIDDFTLEMACHQGDHWGVPAYSDPSSVNRSECEFTTHYAAGKEITITERITIMPGPVSTASFAALNQLHTESDTPPSPFGFQIEEGTDHLQVVLQSPTSNWFRPWRDAKPVERGKQYNFKAVMTMGSNGKVDVWIDGNQVCNYRGSVGASSGGYYWKWGCYRGNVAENLTIRHANMHITVA